MDSSNIPQAFIAEVAAKLHRLLPWQLEQFATAIASAEQAALNPSKCRSCKALIVWGKTAAGKSCPFDYETGRSHFQTCPEAGTWSKSSKLRTTVDTEISSQSTSSEFEPLKPLKTFEIDPSMAAMPPQLEYYCPQCCKWLSRSEITEKFYGDYQEQLCCCGHEVYHQFDKRAPQVECGNSNV